MVFKTPISFHILSIVFISKFPWAFLMNELYKILVSSVVLSGQKLVGPTYGIVTTFAKLSGESFISTINCDTNPLVSHNV